MCGKGNGASVHPYLDAILAKGLIQPFLHGTLYGIAPSFTVFAHHISQSNLFGLAVEGDRECFAAEVFGLDLALIHHLLVSVHLEGGTFVFNSRIQVGNHVSKFAISPANGNAVTIGGLVFQFNGALGAHIDLDQFIRTDNIPIVIFQSLLGEFFVESFLEFIHIQCTVGLRKILIGVKCQLDGLICTIIDGKGTTHLADYHRLTPVHGGAYSTAIQFGGRITGSRSQLFHTIDGDLAAAFASGRDQIGIFATSCGNDGVFEK